ncbi:hypothetical protein TrVE_jg2146 [Triparma verrucosa]|uniref:Uncharacterized protein n=1 Tax=Triparma verrucosa TaxID=1606542 RepID=A0A9W7ELE1_9STRA|nr:hypothetical protein TrVE_jg2146 [Triparma verrucosa]
MFFDNWLFGRNYILDTWRLDDCHNFHNRLYLYRLFDWLHNCWHFLGRRLFYHRLFYNRLFYNRLFYNWLFYNWLFYHRLFFDRSRCRRGCRHGYRHE